MGEQRKEISRTPHRHARRVLLCLAVLISWMARGAPSPKTIAYSAVPNDYLNDHAPDVARIYDGLFFVIGSWDDGIRANIGMGNDSPPTTDWMVRVRENIARLTKAGVSENLLGVCFGENDAWPSAETLLSAEYTRKMTRHFAVLGNAARELGFRGVSIDIEYCYKRYELANEIYTYEGYTTDDLICAADAQGRAVVCALLDSFPEAVIFSLPGEFRMPPIGRAFLLGMLSAMAERDAPGGLHLGVERSYSLLEGPVSQLAISEIADGSAELLLTGRDLAYWKARCDVAPGVWPLHMVETGGKDYPARPWRDEMAELKQQMKILRAIAKKYVWSFSCAPMWYVPQPDFEQEYGLRTEPFENAREVIEQWRQILADRNPGKFSAERSLIRSIHRYRKGLISYRQLCERFGTPADWMMLGPLANPFTRPEYGSVVYSLNKADISAAYQGRDTVVHWFPFHNYEPTGRVSLRAAFEWRNTDQSAAQALTLVRSRRQEEAILHLGWDDGVVVWLDDTVVFDRRSYPEKGHGMVFRDRYSFEEQVPLRIPKGTSCLRISCINSHGAWGFTLRITGKDGLPIRGVTFGLPPTCD